MIPDAKLMLDMLRNHKVVLKTLLEDYGWSERESGAYTKRVKMIEDGRTIKS